MNSASIKIEDRFIYLEPGVIYARRWIPYNGNVSPPIILMHDSLGCVELWRDFPEKLCEATGHTIIAYDRLGFGNSSPRDETMPLDFVSAESDSTIPAIIQTFGINKFVLFGHSVGGGMAVVCASKFNTQCVGLITESAQAFIEDVTLEGIRKAKENSGSHIERLRKYHGQKAEWVFHAWVDTWLSSQFASWSLKNDLPNINSPLLAIHGDRDEYASIKQPEMICFLTGGPARMMIISDCGHIPHREKQDEILKITSEFIRFDMAKTTGH